MVDELARRFESGAVPVRLTMRGLDAVTQRAIADLLGADRTPGAEVQLRVDRLLGPLGLRTAADLRTVVESLRGPLSDRRAAREAALLERTSLWSWLEESAAAVAPGGDGPGLGTWVEEQRRARARGGVTAHRRRLEAALSVLRRLPADGIPVPALANDSTGDPHALDQGRKLSAMVLDAIAIAYGRPRATDAESGRSLWEAAGVVPDPHSSTALALGLPGDDRSPLGQWLSACAADREPVVVSLANLRRWPVAPLPAGSVVHVVENPSLVAEASATRWRGPPLVCSSGRPTVAVVTLIRQLTAADAIALQHADFDPAGLSITAWLAERAGTVPWRMTAADYLGSLPATAPAFAGTPPETPWDPELRDALAQHGRALYEEEIRGELLGAMGELRRSEMKGPHRSTSLGIARPGPVPS